MYVFFFFSSRRRHTRCSRDWSSDVCSSDLSSLEVWVYQKRTFLCSKMGISLNSEIGRASCRGKSVDLGGRRIIKKKKDIGGAKGPGCHVPQAAAARLGWSSVA